MGTVRRPGATLSVRRSAHQPTGSLRVQRPQPRVPWATGAHSVGVGGGRKGPERRPTRARFCCLKRPVFQGQRRAGRGSRPGRTAKGCGRGRPCPAGAAGSLGCRAGCEDLRAEIGPLRRFPRKPPLKRQTEVTRSLCRKPKQGNDWHKEPQVLSGKQEKGARFSSQLLKSLRQTGGGGGSCGKVDWTGSLGLFLPMSSLPPIPPPARSDLLIPRTRSCSSEI